MADESSTSKPVRHFTILLGMAAEMAFGFLASALAARLLLTEGRGQLGRWTFWGQLVANVLTIAVNTTIPQLVGAGRIKKTEASALAVLYVLVIAPLAVVLGYAASAFAVRHDDPFVGGWWFTVACFIPATIMGLAGQGALIARSNVGRMMILRVVGRFAYLGVIVILMVRSEHSPSVVAAASAGQALFTGATLMIAAQPRSPRTIAPGVVSAAFRRATSNHVPALVLVAISCLDQGWVYTKLSNAEAGIFASAMGAALTLDVVGFAEITISTVGMADPIHGRSHSKRALKRTAMYAVLALVAGWVIAPFAIPFLYGSAFRPAVPIFRILLTGGVLYNIGRVAEAALQAADRARAAWVFQLGRGIALLVLMVLFGIRGGIRGVSFATAGASATAAILVLTAFALAGRPRRRVNGDALG